MPHFVCGVRSSELVQNTVFQGQYSAMNTNTSTSVGSLTSLEGSLLAEEAGPDTRCVPSQPSLFWVSSLACSPPLQPRASPKPTSSVSAFHALPLPPPTFRSPPVWWVDGLELTEEVFDTPGLGGLADTEEVPIGLPSTTHPSCVACLPILLFLPPAYQVSPATEQVAMSPPMPAHQVNVTSAAVQAVPSLLSASEEEATSVTVHVASLATVQVATQQPMSASDEEATQAPVHLALVATAQVATPTLQSVEYFPSTLCDSIRKDIITTHGSGPLGRHEFGGQSGEQYGCPTYGGDFVSSFSHSAMPSSMANVPLSLSVCHLTQLSAARGSSRIHSSRTVLRFDDGDDPSTHRTDTTSLPSDVMGGGQCLPSSTCSVHIAILSDVHSSWSSMIASVACGCAVVPIQAQANAEERTIYACASPPSLVWDGIVAPSWCQVTVPDSLLRSVRWSIGAMGLGFIHSFQSMDSSSLCRDGVNNMDSTDYVLGGENLFDLWSSRVRSPECDVLVMGKASSADEHLACSLFTGFGTSRNLCYVALWLYFLLDVQIAMAASSTLSPVNAICFHCNVRMLSEDTLLDYLLLDASSDGSMIILGDISRGGMALADSSLGN